MEPISLTAIAVVVAFVFVSFRYPSALKRVAKPIDNLLDVGNLMASDMLDAKTKEIVENGKKHVVKEADLKTFLGNQEALKSARDAILQ